MRKRLWQVDINIELVYYSYVIQYNEITYRFGDSDLESPYEFVTSELIR